MSDEKTLTHIGVLGMKWGRHRAGSPSQQRDAKRAASRQKVSYDGNGKQTTGPKSWRIGKEKGMSDKRFDKIFDDEMKQLNKEVKAEQAAKIKKQAATVIKNREATQQLIKSSLYFRQSKWVDQKLGGHPDSSPAAVIARNLIGQAALTVVAIKIIDKMMG